MVYSRVQALSSLIFSFGNGHECYNLHLYLSHAVRKFTRVVCVPVCLLAIQQCSIYNNINDSILPEVN